MADGAEGLLRPGAQARSDAAAWRDAQRDAAAFVVDFARGGYGPHGPAKLLVAGDGDARWVRSPALALREGATGPLLAPYADLAARLHRHAGDQATTGVLLAARLVEAALRADAPAAPVWLDGYALAGRQAKGWLGAHAEPAAPEQALSAVAPPAWTGAVVPGLAALADAMRQAGGALDLDDVEVRAEPAPGGRGEADAPLWLPGVTVDPQDEPPAAATGSPAGVLLLSAGWSPKPRAEGVQATARDPGLLRGLAAAEDARRDAAASQVARLGVRFVAAAAGLDDGLRGRLASRGVAVWTDAPRPALRRLERATGARAVARLEDAAAADVGRGTLSRRPRRAGWLLVADGPAATLAVPAQSAPARDAAVEQAERLLRAAGQVLAAPRAAALPGGGRWQRGLAASLRSAADAAPGKAPIAVRAAADAVAALADDLLRNAGRDPLAGGVLPGAEAVRDPAPCVRLAVAGAFEAARAVLRLDGAYAKRPSAPADLRGGTGRAGSPKGLPGDLPPLM